MRLKGKVAIVTGAASGIGCRVAHVFAREGAQLTLVDINEAGLRETLAGLPEGQAIALPADVSRSNYVRDAIDKAMSKYGRLTTIVGLSGSAENRRGTSRETISLLRTHHPGSRYPRGR